jgi:hypothetical protein
MKALFHPNHANAEIPQITRIFDGYLYELFSRAINTEKWDK